MVGDIWQWTPFMFIILLAALEGQDADTVEAGWSTAPNRWQVFLPHLAAGDPAGVRHGHPHSGSSRRSRSSTSPTS